MGRWHQVDPEVDNLEGWSPYNNNLNNPIRYSDPDGDFPIPIMVATGLAGGIVGGLASGIIAIAEGKDTQDVLIAAGGGFVGGAIIGSGAGLLTTLGTGVAAAGGTIAINAASGFLSGAAQEGTTQALEKVAGSRESFDTGKIVKSAAVSTVSNVVAGGIVDKFVKPITDKLVANVSSRVAVGTAARTTSQQAQQQVRQNILKSTPALRNNNKALNAAVGKEIRQRQKEAVSLGQSTAKVVNGASQVAVEAVNQKATQPITDKLNEKNK